MTINDRIKAVRIQNHLTQIEFGKIIGLKDAAVSNLEKPGRAVVDRNILIICEKFHISRQWLESGIGNMNAVNFSREDFLLNWAMKVSKDPSDSFPRKLAMILSRLELDDWKKIEEITKKIMKEHHNIENIDSIEEARAEAHRAVDAEFDQRKRGQTSTSLDTISSSKA